MDRPAEGAVVVTGRLYLAADGAMDRPADGTEDGAEVVTGRHYPEADGAMDRPADGVEVVTGRHRLEADGADGSLRAGAALTRQSLVLLAWAQWTRGLTRSPRPP
jgi:hypothetical protein